MASLQIIDLAIGRLICLLFRWIIVYCYLKKKIFSFQKNFFEEASAIFKLIVKPQVFLHFDILQTFNFIFFFKQNC
jgi:hypothetical protein